MVHNGIEYGDMQLICEAYFVLKQALGLTNDELYDVFAEWNHGELNSYLIEITRDIFSVKDPETGGYLVDLILDTAGAKGTGKWMSQLALDLGVPSTLVTEAVYARCLSAMKDARVRASKVLNGPDGASSTATAQAFIEQVRAGPVRLEDLQLRPGLRADAGRGRGAQLAARTTATIALLWRGGCIIRARVPGADQGGVRRRRRTWRTCCWRPTSREAVEQGPAGLAARGGDGRRAGHSRAGLRRRAWPTTTAIARSGCRPTCCRPSAITSAPTRTSASTSRACSTPIGWSKDEGRLSDDIKWHAA